MLRTLTFLALLALPTPALAAGGPFGAGIILGEPSGLSLKLFLDKRHAIDAALDFSFIHDALYVHADYLLHFPGALPHQLVPYVGIGGKVKVREHKGDDRGDLAARAPFGLTWMPRRVPIDVFVELVALLEVVPELEPGVEAGLGVRYWF